MDNIIENRYVVRIIFSESNLKKLSEFCRVVYVTKLLLNNNEKLIFIECFDKDILCDIEKLSFVLNVTNERKGRLL